MTSDKSDKITGGETLRWSNWLLTSKTRIVPEHPYHMQTHCLPDRKSRGKLQEKRVRIPGTGSVFTYGKVA